MKLRFLCGQHRKLLNLHPDKAIHCWQNGFDMGQYFCDQQHWNEALPHLGCAFEAAEIVLTKRNIDTESACELFVASAAHLIIAYGKLGYRDQSQEVCCMAVRRLTEELTRNPVTEMGVANHLEYLYGQLQDSNCLEQSSLETFTNSSGVAIH